MSRRLHLVIDWPWSWPVIRNSLVMTAQQWVHCLVILFSFTSILPPLYSSFLMNLCHVARCRRSWCQTRRRRHCCLRMPRAWVVATSLLDTLATISMSILANSPIEKKERYWSLRLGKSFVWYIGLPTWKFTNWWYYSFSASNILV